MSDEAPAADPVAPANSPPVTGAEQPAPAPGSVETPAPVHPQLDEERPVGSPDPAAPDTQAPTVQPPLPVPVFGEHGAASKDAAVVPAVKKGVYVDSDGVKHDVEIVAERKDGSVDIMLPATVGGYRRDAVRRRGSDEQTTDYME